MDAEVRFSGKSVESGALRLQDLSAQLRLDDGLLTVTPLELGLAEGRITPDIRRAGRDELPKIAGHEIGTAAGRGRVCQHLRISVAAVPRKKNKKNKTST